MDLLTGPEVAEILKISESQAYTLMRRQEIPVVKFGRTVRVRRQDLEEFVKNSLRPTRKSVLQ